MSEFFVNVKRFDVPKEYGGICPTTDPAQWIRDVIVQTMELGLGNLGGVKLTYLLPEALLVPAQERLAMFSDEQKKNFSIGCQGVYREDVKTGENFGAFTSNRPAAAMSAIGAKWALIGHSEERKDKLSLLMSYDPGIGSKPELYLRAEETVSTLLNQEVRSALKRKMNVLFCIGETAEQKGSNDPQEYEPRVREVLKSQLEGGLAGINVLSAEANIVIGYEPVWAIGPGKTPPNGDYVAFVTEYIKNVCKEMFGKAIPVVYGGGLKEENAAEMAAVKTLDGGLVALTKFTQPVAFDVVSLQKIIEEYQKNRKNF